MWEVENISIVNEESMLCQVIRTAHYLGVQSVIDAVMTPFVTENFFNQTVISFARLLGQLPENQSSIDVKKINKSISMTEAQLCQTFFKFPGLRGWVENDLQDEEKEKVDLSDISEFKAFTERIFKPLM